MVTSIRNFQNLYGRTNRTYESVVKIVIEIEVCI